MYTYAFWAIAYYWHKYFYHCEKIIFAQITKGSLVFACGQENGRLGGTFDFGESCSCERKFPWEGAFTIQLYAGTVPNGRGQIRFIRGILAVP